MNLFSRPVRIASFPRWGGGCLLLTLLAGCNRDGVEAYRVPKESPHTADQAADAQAGVGHPTAPAVHWKAPPDWKEQPADTVRVARFIVPGKEAGDAEVSIVPLTGMAATKGDLVNFWRQQIHLPEMKEPELSSQADKALIGNDQGEIFDMVSTESIIQGKLKARVLVAKLTQGPTTWFFKMTGEEALVREQKPAFLDFLKSISFEAAPAVPTMPAARDLTGGNPALPPAVGATGDADGKPTWEVPANWTEQPAGQMLLAKFLLTGTGSGKAEVTVSVFPGDVGGLLANVNRWRGQVGLAPVAQSDLATQTAPLDVNGGKATLVDVTGTSKSGQKARLIGAVVPRDGRTWFFKLMGDDQVATQEKPAFLKFIQTVRYPNAG